MPMFTHLAIVGVVFMTEEKMLALGDVVRSKNGRFKGEFFVVVALEEDFAYLVNGKQRKMDSPKKKKIKHLEAGIGHSDHIGEKLTNGLKVTNNEVRITLNSVKEI